MMTRNGEIIVNDFRGINVNDNAFNIDDSEAQEATNVVVTNRSVEVRGGFTIHSQNDDVTGGVPFMCPYYKRDGTVQLVFANQDKYYYITPDDTTWVLIGDYGTSVVNPFIYQYKDYIVFGTGKIGNKSFKYDAVVTTYTASTIAFVDSNPDTITDSANGLGSFRANDILIISGGVNDGVQVTINSVAAGTLTLKSYDSITAEAAGNSITLKSTGMSLQTTPADSTGDLRFYAKYGGQDVKYLIGGGLEKDADAANITSMFYTPDPDNWADSNAGVLQVGPSDGQDLVGAITNNNLVAYKEKSKHYYADFYQQDAGVFALREQGSESSSGGVCQETLLVIDGDIVTLTEKGKSIEGYGLEGTSQGNGRPKQYATNINPILNNLNWQKTIMKKAHGIFHDRMAFFAAPYLSSQFNNLLLVGDWDSPTRNSQPSWTTFGKAVQGMAVFRDSNGEDQLYFGDANSPIIYKYDKNSYSDNGSNYTRRWKSKKFSLGRQTDYNDAIHVIIEGYIVLGTEFFLKIDVDGKTQVYKITKNNLINALGGGGYIGDHYIGDEIIGGNGIKSNKFRYQAVCQVPNSMRYCKNIEITVYNSEAGQYWSMDYLSINEEINLDDLPDSSKNVEAVN